MTAPLSVGVLASGRGSNLRALLAACERHEIRARVSLVISNLPDAPALEHAAAHGVPSLVVSHKAFGKDRGAFEVALTEALEAHGADLVVLAGFMRILSPVFVTRWSGRLLNIHPSLLPAFPGLDAQAQALEAGVRVAGCTVHLGDAGTDTGPIVAQAAVPVHEDDTVETLSARILVEEHRLLPRVVGWFAEGRVHLDGRRARVTP